MNQKPIIEITVNENAVIHFELWPEIAPIACASVMRLAEKRIFDGRAIERLEPGFVLQPLFFDGVDPQIDIMIKPEFKTNPENAKITFHRGIVAMAGDPENSSGSQYYITLAASERLNGNFTVIGKVIDGWDEIERLEHVEVEEAIEPQSKNRRKECNYGRAWYTGRALYGEDRRKSYWCNRDRSWTGQCICQALYGSCIHS